MDNNYFYYVKDNNGEPICVLEFEELIDPEKMQELLDYAQQLYENNDHLSNYYSDSMSFALSILLTKYTFKLHYLNRSLVLTLKD